jgi:poly(A) polymerase
MNTSHHQSAAASLLSSFPESLIEALVQVERQQGFPFYITGGTLRDRFLGRTPFDLDITVKEGALQCCKKVLDVLKGGALVVLGTDTEEAARVVSRGYSIDFSTFRKGAATIEEELHHRDYTINAMAVELRHSLEPQAHIIDPLGGYRDLKDRMLRCCPEAFHDDPLRMLRGYRLRAELAFAMDHDCVEMIGRWSADIGGCSSERVHGELERIMMTTSAATVFREMADSTLLFRILPELEEGVGLEQPGYHHEDVFHHSLSALQCLEPVMAKPRRYFGEYADTIITYLEDAGRRRHLRWSALFHDLGKPATCSSGTMAGGKITFYNHDRVGRRIFADIAGRLRMSNAETARIGTLIEMHMHPFHLANSRRAGGLSRRALLRLCKKAGNELPGLFMLAMADSLAGQGESKPEGMEEELALLFDEVQAANEKHVQPALRGERLLTGHDLVEIFNLSPGPRFRKILDELEVVRVEEKVRSREEALSWLRDYLKKDK